MFLAALYSTPLAPPDSLSHLHRFPRAGAAVGVLMQVLAEPARLPPSTFRRGGASRLWENLYRDRCAYQTPALSPAPRVYNYLLVSLSRNTSNVEGNIFKELCSQLKLQYMWTYCHIFFNIIRFCILLVVIHSIKTHWNRFSWQQTGVKGGDLGYFELFM